MDNVGIAYEHYAGEPMWLHVTGPLRPGWCGNLAAGLAGRGLGIVRAHAVALAAGSWDARFELRCPPDRTPSRSALRSMLETDAGAGFTTPLPLIGFALATSPSRGGCLRLDVAGEDGVGFLAALLRRLAFHSLFPVELGLDTVQGQARDRLWLRGPGDTRPLPRAELALRASLEALARARGGRVEPSCVELAIPG